jgi:hypothetical protein
MGANVDLCLYPSMDHVVIDDEIAVARKIFVTCAKTGAANEEMKVLSTRTGARREATG